MRRPGHTIHVFSLSQNTLNSSNSSFPLPLVCAQRVKEDASEFRPKAPHGASCLGYGRGGQWAGVGSWEQVPGSEGGGSLLACESLKRGRGRGEMEAAPKGSKNTQLLQSLGQDPEAPQVPSEVFPMPPRTVRAPCLCSNPRGRCLPGFVCSQRKRPAG